MPGSGRGAGPFNNGSKLLASTFVGQLYVPWVCHFFCLMEQATSNGVSKEKSQHRIANGNVKWGILL
jgi:hypothetical protein